MSLMESATIQQNQISPRPVIPSRVPTGRVISFRTKYRNAYNLKHPEKLKERRKRWYEKYKERENAKRQERRKKLIGEDLLAHRKRECERAMIYRQANLEKIKARHRIYAKRMYPSIKLQKIKLREEFLIEYGSKCNCCGILEKEFLTLEHINHDGAKHRKAVGYSSASVLADLKKQGWPKDAYTLLCWNCNMGTRFGNICPHKQQR